MISAPLHAADSVPRCWRQDLQDEDIQDGLFRVQVATSNNGAREVAIVLAILAQSLSAQTGVAPSSDLEKIEIDMFGETKYWRPSVNFPTLESYKSAVVNSLAPVLKMNTVIECAKVNHHTPGSR